MTGDMLDALDVIEEEMQALRTEARRLRDRVTELEGLTRRAQKLVPWHHDDEQRWQIDANRILGAK